MSSLTTTGDGLSQFSYRKTVIVGFGFLGMSIIWPSGRIGNAGKYRDE